MTSMQLDPVRHLPAAESHNVNSDRPVDAGGRVAMCESAADADVDAESDSVVVLAGRQ